MFVTIFPFQNGNRQMCKTIYHRVEFSCAQVWQRQNDGRTLISICKILTTRKRPEGWYKTAWKTSPDFSTLYDISFEIFYPRIWDRYYINPKISEAGIVPERRHWPSSGDGLLFQWLAFCQKSIFEPLQPVQRGICIVESRRQPRHKWRPIRNADNSFALWLQPMLHPPIHRMGVVAILPVDVVVPS